MREEIIAGGGGWWSKKSGPSRADPPPVGAFDPRFPSRIKILLVIAIYLAALATRESRVFPTFRNLSLMRV